MQSEPASARELFDAYAAITVSRGLAPLLNSVTLLLTSVTKCFPGPSPNGKGVRSPSGAEIALCRSHLDREIALVQPKLVITLGKLAASVLIGPAPLADIVGTVREAERAGQRFQVLPLPHPSGVSRWLNEPQNRERHARALAMLGDLARNL